MNGDDHNTEHHMSAAEFHELVRRNFSQRLKQARIAARFETAQRFAFAMGIEVATYRSWERGDAEPSLDMLQRLCVALHISPSDILGFSTLPRLGGE